MPLQKEILLSTNAPSNITPLNRQEISSYALELVEWTQQKEVILRTIQKWNSSVLDNRNAPLYLDLTYRRGFGDLVRGSHWYSLFKTWSGREPIIVTNYPELFYGHCTLLPDKPKSNKGYRVDGVSVIKPRILQPVLEPRGNDKFKDVMRALLHVNPGSHPPHLRDLNQLQVLQVLSQACFGQTVDSFPKGALSFSPEAHEKAKAQVARLGLIQSQIPLLIFPDAAEGINFTSKRWHLEYYGKVLSSLTDRWKERLRIFILTGLEHPEETIKLSSYLQTGGISHSVVEEIRDISEFGAFIKELAHQKAVMLGLEGFVAGHLGPMLGIWSVVIGWNPGYHKIYAPVEPGSTLIEGFDGWKPQPEQVLEALNQRINLLAR